MEDRELGDQEFSEDSLFTRAQSAFRERCAERHLRLLVVGLANGPPTTIDPASFQRTGQRTQSLSVSTDPPLLLISHSS